MLVQSICNGLEDKSSDEALYMIRDTHHNLGTASGETNDIGRFLEESGIWLEMLLQRENVDESLVVDYELGMGYDEHGNSGHARSVGNGELALLPSSRGFPRPAALPRNHGWLVSSEPGTHLLDPG